MSRWEGVALGAAIIALIAPFIYLSRTDHSISTPVQKELAFVGSQSCATCHKTVFDSWRGSDHDLAMARATEKTVLGDFDEATYRDPYTDIISRFYREEGRYMVETEGVDGTLEAFEISHTFGVYPLQQYLIPFPGGRLQSLNIGWDVRNEKWYRLPPYEIENTDDWLHWTKDGQTWNAMCAECHSTRLSKGYDIVSDSYDTTWSEINVGCEACHGPGSKHLDWAERPPLARPAAPNYKLAVQTANLDAAEQISICAPCHSRRYQLGDNVHDQGELLDKIVPSLLEEGLYYPDGQIQEEVYVYGSFSQSKMFRHNVRCSDCHNVHNLALRKEGNELCLQCHRAETYDNYEHHFHQREYKSKPSEGYLCVKCHMPGRIYMGIDYRPDHSLRIPRPDLSAKIDTPNGCSAQGCHADKELDWVITNYKKWYGKSRKPHYGEVFYAARQGDPGSAEGLRNLAADRLLPAIVRATALSLLRNHPGDDTTAAFSAALQDEDALIRYTAIRGLDQLDRETKLRLIAPKLYDPVKGVRIEAALSLADIPDPMLRPEDVAVREKGLVEYRSAMLYNSDFAPQRYNLGNLAALQGKPDKAEAYYQGAIAIDTQFYPAKVNLAMLHNQNGENEKAETLLREVLDDNPDLYEIAYSLGLLLAEMQNYRDAATYLGRAADGMPLYPRVRYNQALALMKLERWQESEQALLKALDQEPANREFFMTLANLYLNFRKLERARVLAEATLEKVPDHPDARELLDMLSR
jgi:tetratricopeptide (TPR) repeat protein